MSKSNWHICSGVLVACLLVSSVDAAVELKPSAFERELHRIRFVGTATSLTRSGSELTAFSTGEEQGDFGDGTVKRKSPLKAFLLSAALPGAGQFYLGNRIKPLVYLGVEAAAWGFHFKYQGQGDDATDAYQAFNRAHWSRDAYEQKYLLWAYGVTDDELVSASEVSHHLPDGETQQYFEMTGKYNQFAWGWDDAVRDGRTLDDYANDPAVAVTGDDTTPYSARRVIYEGMRNDANRKYDKATKLVIVSLVNRVVSAFEAMFSAQKFNRSLGSGSSPFARVKVQMSLKSYNSRRDTPYVKLSYKF